jgi:hypothetical protein
VQHVILAATPVARLRAGLDLNGDGALGWPDALAWLLIGTVALLGLAVVFGMTFAGVTVSAHGLGRIRRAAPDGLRHRARHRTGPTRLPSVAKPARNGQ